MKVLAWLIGVPVGLFVLMLIIGALSGPPDEKSRARDTIELCWSDHAKKSLDPSTARLVASTCERLEAEFLQRYGVKP